MKRTKKMILAAAAALVLLANLSAARAQENGARVDSSAPENLDLYAVAELFRDSENLEKFEQALNNPANGLSNLDLNDDDEIDFLRVVEQSSGDSRLVVLQAVLGENEFQDVATILVEREAGGRYDLRIQGDAVVYGANYYVVPAAAGGFSAWNVVRWLFSPGYRVYVSPYRHRIYPAWWGARRPVAVGVYRARVAPFAVRKNFVATKTVRTVNRINYRPRTSTLVTRKTTTAHVKSNNNPRGGGGVTTTRTKTTVKRGKRN